MSSPVMRGRLAAVAGGLSLLVWTGCATVSTYSPAALDEVPFLERAVSERQGDLEVTTAVLSPEESRQLFGFKLASKRIQPVWIEISNQDDHDYWLFARSLDPDYFSPFEVAWMGRRKYTKSARRHMEVFLHSRSIPFRVVAGEVISGFVFANLDLGLRQVLVELISAHREVARFEFLLDVPGLRTDYQQVDFQGLYDARTDLDEAGLRQWLSEQPCCTVNQAGSKQGDPLNIVVVGAGEAVWPAFVRAGWDVTETMTSASVWRTVKSSVFRRRYRYSPVSPLYVYDRPQDIALQKARGTVDERNHLRLWLAPVTFQGENVWIGQISRDIGVRFTTKSPTISTHKIDPDVDETRTYLIQDLLYSQGLTRFAYVSGVGEAPLGAPRYNLTGDPYFTDGLRVVLFMSPESVAIDEIDYLEWEQPRQR